MFPDLPDPDILVRQFGVGDNLVTCGGIHAACPQAVREFILEDFPGVRLLENPDDDDLPDRSPVIVILPGIRHLRGGAGKRQTETDEQEKHEPLRQGLHCFLSLQDTFVPRHPFQRTVIRKMRRGPTEEAAEQRVDPGPTPLNPSPPFTSAGTATFGSSQMGDLAGQTIWPEAHASNVSPTCSPTGNAPSSPGRDVPSRRERRRPPRCLLREEPVAASSTSGGAGMLSEYRV